MSSLVKRYTYAADDPWAMSGGMPAYPSQSTTQPGGTRVGVRAQTVKGPMSGSYGAGLYAGFGDERSVGPQALPDFGAPKAEASLSPYEGEYRQAGRGWESLRSTLASNLQALATPQGYASAGLPGSYWKQTSDKRIGDINAGADAKRSDIEARYRRGAINSAQRVQELEDLERDARDARATTSAGVATERVDQGMKAVGQSAGILGSLYGQVPVAAAPQMIPLSEAKSVFSVSGKGSPVKAAVREFNIAWPNGAPKEQREAFKTMLTTMVTGTAASANSY